VSIADHTESLNQPKRPQALPPSQTKRQVCSTK
jgi:hypothetical protein